MNQKGIALIEVLVSVFILAVGLLGLASLQFMSLKNMQMAEKSDTANLYMQQIAEAMRSNKTAADTFISGSGDIGTISPITCDQNCGFDVAAEAALQRVKNALAEQFNGGVLTIERSNNLGSYTLSDFTTDRQGNTETTSVTYNIDIYTITLEWQEQGSFLLKDNSVQNRRETLKVTL